MQAQILVWAKLAALGGVVVGRLPRHARVVIPHGQLAGRLIQVDRQVGVHGDTLTLDMLVEPDALAIEIQQKRRLIQEPSVRGDEAQGVTPRGHRRQLFPESPRPFGGVRPQFIPGSQAVITPRGARIFAGNRPDCGAIGQRDQLRLHLGAAPQLRVVPQESLQRLKDARRGLLKVIGNDQDFVRRFLSERPPENHNGVDGALTGFFDRRIDDRVAD
jgi:hypothetical protein